MNKLAEIQNQIHTESLDLRCLDRYLRSTQFENAFSMANIEDKRQLEKQIKTKDLWRLRQKVKNILIDTTDLDTLSVENLRIKASELSVTNYARLSKLELVAELRRAYGKKEKTVS